MPALQWELKACCIAHAPLRSDWKLSGPKRWKDRLPRSGVLGEPFRRVYLICRRLSADGRM